MSQLDFVLTRLDSVRKYGSQFYARCPAHDDKNPSLAVIEGSKGQVLLHCHAGCSQESVISAMGLTLKDLYPNDRSPSRWKQSILTAREAFEVLHREIWIVLIVINNIRLNKTVSEIDLQSFNKACERIQKIYSEFCHV